MLLLDNAEMCGWLHEELVREAQERAEAQQRTGSK